MSHNDNTSALPQVVPQTNIDNFSQGLTRYLVQLELPVDRVLVLPKERLTVMNNLSSIIEYLSPEQKSEAMYISKFIAACAAGLFDAALNFLWNETVTNLRQKVIRFDMDYFLDSVVTDTKRRTTFRNEDDLKHLDDWELIKGCKDTGIITEIGYKHLDYVREMRNHASAAHPNHNDLDGLQLSSWLQTCIKEVLAKDPEGPVIEVKKLLINLRLNVLSPSDIPPIRANLQQLPIDLVDSTLRAIFGMYTDSTLATSIRNNLNLIIQSIWENSSTQAKFDCGLKYSVFSANAEIARKNLANDFLKSITDGLSYLPDDHKAIEMDAVLDALYSAHMGWNNFHNEPPHARSLSKFIPANGKIPREVLGKYVTNLVMCAIGNGYGVSTAAEPIYDELINRFSDFHYLVFIKLLSLADIQSHLNHHQAANNYQSLAATFAERTTNHVLKELLHSIAKTHKDVLPKLWLDTRFNAQVRSVTLA